ncbi:phosphatidylglycerophosphatase A [gamma proteobacterium HTCC5015]|nr:phosphatidylglycerophosphatase A [gamma proteobacterium HTCC5015]
MSDTNPSFVQLLRHPVHFLAFGFGSGLSPVAPGTAGSLMAVPLFYALFMLPLPLYVGVLVAASIVGVYLCGKTARDLGVHDHGGIVWDEFAGLWLTLLPLQSMGGPSEWRFWLIVAVGFAVFRLFDAVKPWPIRWLDKNVHGGTGIMLDDIAAGALSLGVVQALIYGGL